MCAADPSVRLTLSARIYSQVAAQMTFSEAIAVFEDGIATPSALFGWCMLPDGDTECWFLVRPDLPWQVLLAILRHAQRFFAAYPGPMIAMIAAGHKPGERMAKICGFAPQGVYLSDSQKWRRAA